MTNIQTAFLKDLNSKLYTLGELTVIGSDDSSHIQVNTMNTSARHARIEWRENSFILRDLRSNSGTFINNTQVLEAILNEGDRIQIGEQIFEYTTESKIKNTSFFKSKNDQWQKQLNFVPNIAQSDFPVLILGPSGTGKELLAESMHNLSNRSNKPFISVNCSALTETLIESELFGHVKGSFTGAYQDRKGAFEIARGGTLFLDEIGDLPYSLQAKLLRALENNEIRPVGSDHTIKTDVRIVAATHQNLTESIQLKTFRQDLFFRLNVISITSPSLKERIEDFEDLLFYYAKKYKVRFSFGAIQILKKQNWNGNIRELKNLVARASALFTSKSVTEAEIEQLISFSNNFREVMPMQPLSARSPYIIKEIEKEMILRKLTENKGNQRRTASDLGMPKSTLHDRIRFYNIDLNEFKKNFSIEK